jgi:hypothetical protein
MRDGLEFVCGRKKLDFFGNPARFNRPIFTPTAFNLSKIAIRRLNRRGCPLQVTDALRFLTPKSATCFWQTALADWKRRKYYFAKRLLSRPRAAQRDAGIGSAKYIHQRIDSAS